MADNADRERHAVEDEERKYWTQVPNILWELGLPLRAWAIYVYVKRRAGDSSECYQSTRRMARATGISQASVRRGIKLLEAVGLIKRELRKRGDGERGWKTWHITIVDIWQQNMAYCGREKKEWAVEWVKDMQQRVAQSEPGGRALQSEPGGLESEPQQAAKKNPKENTSKECVNGTSADSCERVQGEAMEGNGALRGKAAEQPAPKILTGTGDSQRDMVDSIGAGTGAKQAKELLAQAMYKALWPTLDWPDGTGKAASDARAAALRSADRVLERIGRENYREALDACHLLMTEPTEDEARWLDKAKTIYALIDTVTTKVDELRKRQRQRQEALAWNDLVQAAWEDGAESGAQADEPPVPAVAVQQEQWWKEALFHLENSMAPATFNAYLRNTAASVDDTTCTVAVQDDRSLQWANTRLRHLVERAVARVRGEPLEVRFVALEP